MSLHDPYSTIGNARPQSISDQTTECGILSILTTARIQNSSQWLPKIIQIGGEERARMWKHGGATGSPLFLHLINRKNRAEQVQNRLHMYLGSSAIRLLI